MSDDQSKELLDNAIIGLREHFEHVQILVSWAGEGIDHTKSLFRGGGNWFARVGMAEEFLRQDDARTKAQEIKEAIEPPEDNFT